MTSIQRRNIHVRAGKSGETGRVWESNRQIDATVTLTKNREPNTVNLYLFNLSEDSINFLRRPATVIYFSVTEGSVKQTIFSGQINKHGVTTNQSQNGIATEIVASDGHREFVKATISRSYPRGTSRDTILSDLISDLGLPVLYKSDLEAKSYPAGWSFTGKIRDAIDDILDGDADWSIQRGRIQVISPYDDIGGTAPLLSPRSGLVGSPKMQGKDKVIVSASLQPAIVPGSPFAVESARLKADLVATEVQHRVGDGGNIWRSEIKARRI